ncbi:MAG: 16S rRNA (guanine(527)-N(7))-methyltransferase RsmG [Lachnospiraceae bacterium]|nr:16S rRNA (guanine(527)-N(7))-methyltransferase RsmG [Lachnospiraceae bacterium]
MRNNTYLKNLLQKMEILYTEDKLEQIYDFYEMVIEKNKVMNLTSITDHDDFMKKHIADSLAPLMFHVIHEGDRILDLGTGGGFPGIPLKIFLPESEFLLIDSVNKKLDFVQTVIDTFGLQDIYVLHGRAEDLAHKPEYREGYDLVVSRAVANLATLSELSLGFVKPGGQFISYKGSSGVEELKEAEAAVDQMGGSCDNVFEYSLPDGDPRTLIIIQKERSTPRKYPRKAGTPSKSHLK